MKFNYLKFRLEPENRTDAGVEVVLSNRVRVNHSLDVFAPNMENSWTSKSVSGLNVFTALLVVGNNTKLYHEMPVSFSHAVLVGESYCLFGCVTKVDIKGAEMYVNFMSHHSFERRAAHSGPVKLRVLKNGVPKRKNMLKHTLNRHIVNRKKSHSKKSAKPVGGQKSTSKPPEFSNLFEEAPQ